MWEMVVIELAAYGVEAARLQVEWGWGGVGEPWHSLAAQFVCVVTGFQTCIPKRVYCHVMQPNMVMVPPPQHHTWQDEQWSRRKKKFYSTHDVLTDLRTGHKQFREPEQCFSQCTGRTITGMNAIVLRAAAAELGTKTCGRALCGVRGTHIFSQ